MELTKDLSSLAQILREDTISSFEKTANERASIAALSNGYDLLAEVELIETFYLGLLSRVVKRSNIPEEYLLKAQEYSIFKYNLIVDYMINEKNNYPVYSEHLLKIELCRSLFLFYSSKGS